MGYLREVLSGGLMKNRVDVAAKVLGGREFDAIAVTGNSGTLFGGALAMAMGVNVYLVRKPGVDSHGCRVEMEVPPKRVVIVDDFISSGAMAGRVLVRLFADVNRPVVVGFYSYSHEQFLTCKELMNRVSGYTVEEMKKELMKEHATFKILDNGEGVGVYRSNGEAFADGLGWLDEKSIV